MKIFQKSLFALLFISITAFAAGQFPRPNDSDIKQKLTSLQYDVTQKGATEPAFDNAYWNNYEPGIYVDVVSGEPLFSSLDKYDSKTGWPSFTQPLAPSNVTLRKVKGWYTTNTEAISLHGQSHLGHLFYDGPIGPTHYRYCINSAALLFIPVDQLQKKGYGQYLPLFNKQSTK